jgi:hypothetical protein
MQINAKVQENSKALLSVDGTVGGGCYILRMLVFDATLGKLTSSMIEGSSECLNVP